MLPDKQKQVLDYINQYHKSHGHGPTLDEIANYFKKAVPTIHQHVQALRAKGYIKLPGINARGIDIYDSQEEITEIPLLGFVSAGGGIENLENPAPIKIQRSMLSPSGRHYALTVKGNSMIDDGIMPNDIVVVKEQNYGDNGDVVIALTGSQGSSQATIKRFYKLGSKIELRPKNPNLETKVYNVGEVEIRGKFIGLLRRGG